MRLFVAGEGVHEIGKWAQSPEYRSTSERGDGVLAELWRTRHAGTVVGGRAWKNVRKFRAGTPKGDDDAFRAFVLDAQEEKADVLLWSRDADRKPYRAKVLEPLHAQLSQEHAATLRIVGGIQVECLEAWILAIHGSEQRPEDLSVERAEELAAEREIDTEFAMCELIRSKAPNIDTSRSPSLAKWMAQL